jgi:hypothetical protein
MLQARQRGPGGYQQQVEALARFIGGRNYVPFDDIFDSLGISETQACEMRPDLEDLLGIDVDILSRLGGLIIKDRDARQQ